MANIDTAFPSKYLKAHDLGGKTVKLKITGINVEKLGEDLRPVISFNGTEKTLVVNKTNANRITQSYGKETDDWIGKKLIAYNDPNVTFGKDIVGGMRIKQHRKAAAPRELAGRSARNGPTTAGDSDDLTGDPPF